MCTRPDTLLPGPIPAVSFILASARMPLKILIVGAGLAGFSAAVALARHGHDVEIFERSAFSNEVGAALHFGPTTTAYVFPRWGIDAMKDFQACKVERWSNYLVRDGEMERIADRYVSQHSDLCPAPPS